MIPSWSLSPDPWSLVLYQNLDFFSPLLLEGTNAIFFVDVFSASLEIDAQDIKVVLPRYYVLQKDIRLGSAFLAGALVFLGKHELQKAVVFGSGWEKLWCSGRRS